MSKTRFGAKRMLGAALGLAGLSLAFLGVASGATSGPYSAGFTGSPPAPQSALSVLAEWDVQVHSRNSNTWYQLESMSANHGPDCGAPPASHTTSGSYADAVFQCRDHIMTAINASDTSGYAMVYLTPNRMADFSAGTAVLKWDMSTYRHSTRDFVDFWVIPYEDQIALPFDMGDVDGQGVPRRGIHVRMDQFNGETIYRAYVIENFVQNEIPGAWWSTQEAALRAAGRAPSQSVRDTFELQVSTTRVKFGIPALNWWPIDAPVGPLPYTQGVLQIGQHSYNPTKDNSGVPATWHWDNVSINPAIPFTIIKSDQRYVDSPTQTLSFDAPAPADAHIRFSSIGTVDIAFDGGPFQRASRAQSSELGSHPEHLASFWMPIPAGARTVKLKWSADSWYTGPYIAKDFSIWARGSANSTQPTTAPATATPTAAVQNTATPTTAPPTSTPTTVPPTATPTIVPPTATPAQPLSPPPPGSAGSRITWNGKSWYVHGANLPWYNWACDFGCGANGGASSATVKSAVGNAFAQAKANGMNVVRWWVFPGDPWQITRDASGAPTGINPAVYTDLDAAVQLAAQYDIYLDLVLFSSPTAIPNSWVTNATHRQQLAQALGPMFARYKTNPRVMTWEVVNEPEFDIWNNRIGQADTQAMVKAIAGSVHANSPALVTVGSAMLDGLDMWVGQGLDYYQAHWYDYMQPGNWCARCTDYATVKAAYGLDRPLVIGEFFAGSSVDALQRHEDFYAKGYAGAWAWSLLTSRTSDGMSVDLAASKTFASRHADLGPTGSPATNPTATPTSSPTPKPATATPTATKPAGSTATPTAAPTQAALSFTTSVTPSKASVSRSARVTLTTKVTASRAATALVDIEVYGPDGKKVFQKFYDSQSFTAGTVKTFSPSWTVPSTAAKGTYTVKVGIFSPGWGTLYSWKENAATFTVK